MFVYAFVVWAIYDYSLLSNKFRSSKRKKRTISTTTTCPNFWVGDTKFSSSGINVPKKSLSWNMKIRVWSRIRIRWKFKTNFVKWKCHLRIKRVGVKWQPENYKNPPQVNSWLNLWTIGGNMVIAKSVDYNASPKFVVLPQRPQNLQI